MVRWVYITATKITYFNTFTGIHDYVQTADVKQIIKQRPTLFTKMMLIDT